MKSTKISVCAGIGAALVAAAAGRAAVVTISQINGNGLTQHSWAGPTADYIELHNTTGSVVDLTGWAVQTGLSATSTTWVVRPLPAGFTIPAHGYALLQIGTAGTPLNSPNNPDDVYGFVISPDFILTGGALSALGGKVALTNTQVPLTGGCPVGDPSIVDFVGYGGADCSEGSPAPSMSLYDGKSIYRGCTGDNDTNNNAADFVLNYSSPRNRLSPPGLGAMTAVGAPVTADAINVVQTHPVLLTATASSCSGAPAGVSFAANLSFVGGLSAAPMFDDGTHGDAVAGDGIFSLSYTVPDSVLPAPPPGPTINRPYVVPITGTDSLGRTANTFAAFYVTAAPTGSCCITGQGVSVRTQASCLAAGGTYHGDDSVPFSGPGVMYQNSEWAILPDPGSVGSPIVIPDATVINELVVHIWPTHSYLGDLTCTLSNGTTTVTLFQRVGVVGNNATGRPGNLVYTNDYRFYNRGASFWSAAYNGGKDTDYTEPAGYYAPSASGNAPSSLSPFIGTSAQGTWTLTMTDSAAQNAGTFIWGLEINPVSACPAACYANCDNSTAPPILNANDFQCFLNKFAAGNPTANCDGSTAPPILNANDFQCFLNAYAAGCP